MNTNNAGLNLSLRMVFYRSFLFVVLILGFLLLMIGCRDDDDGLYIPPTGLTDHSIVISNISGIPDGVVFDKVVANVTGSCWDVISAVETPYIDGSAILELPATFSSGVLQKSIRSDKKDMCAHWPADVKSTDATALVAKLNDILVYDGDKKVGRIYVSDWSGKGTTASKGFVYYYYADRTFALSGGSSFIYSSASFKNGWNVCVNINSATPEGGNPATCTTIIPDETQLHWLFEGH